MVSSAGTTCEYLYCSYHCCLNDRRAEWSQNITPSRTRPVQTTVLYRYFPYRPDLVCWCCSPQNLQISKLYVRKLSQHDVGWFSNRRQRAFDHGRKRINDSDWRIRIHKKQSSANPQPRKNTLQIFQPLGQDKGHPLSHQPCHSRKQLAFFTRFIVSITSPSSF